MDFRANVAPTGYTSVIKINGRPILPPLMTQDVRDAARMYRELAMQKEEAKKQRAASRAQNMIIPVSHAERQSSSSSRTCDSAIQTCFTLCASSRADDCMSQSQSVSITESTDLERYFNGDSAEKSSLISSDATPTKDRCEDKSPRSDSSSSTIDESLTAANLSLLKSNGSTAGFASSNAAGGLDANDADLAKDLAYTMHVSEPRSRSASFTVDSPSEILLSSSLPKSPLASVRNAQSTSGLSSAAVKLDTQNVRMSLPGAVSSFDAGESAKKRISSAESLADQLGALLETRLRLQDAHARDMEHLKLKQEDEMHQLLRRINLLQMALSAAVESVENCMPSGASKVAAALPEEPSAPIRIDDELHPITSPPIKFLDSSLPKTSQPIRIDNAPLPNTPPIKFLDSSRPKTSPPIRIDDAPAPSHRLHQACDPLPTFNFDNRSDSLQLPSLTLFSANQNKQTAAAKNHPPANEKNHLKLTGKRRLVALAHVPLSAHSEIPITLKLKLGAFIKGHLTRQLLQTDRAKQIIKTIHDSHESIDKCLRAAESNQDRVFACEEEKFHSRLVAQLKSSLNELHRVFFELSPRERIALIATQQQVDKFMILRTTTYTVPPIIGHGPSFPFPLRPQKPLSSATVKRLEQKRKMMQISHANTGRVSPRKSTVKVSAGGQVKRTAMAASHPNLSLSSKPNVSSTPKFMTASKNRPSSTTAKITPRLKCKAVGSTSQRFSPIFSAAAKDRRTNNTLSQSNVPKRASSSLAASNNNASGRNRSALKRPPLLIKGSSSRNGQYDCRNALVGVKKPWK